jgi:hypothetical protein
VVVSEVEVLFTVLETFMGNLSHPYIVVQLALRLFPHIVAIVHTDPYVDLYHYYRRRTLAEVPRHSPFPPFFLSTEGSRFL